MKKYTIALIFFILQIVLSYSQSYTYKGKNLYGIQEYLKDSLQRATNLLFYDIDGDGDQDLIVSGIDSIKYDKSGNVTSFSQITYFFAVQENIGTKWSPKFAARKPFIDSFPFQKGYFLPSVGDINDDHKLDFVVASGLDSNYNLTTLFYQRKALSGKDQFTIITGDKYGLDPFVSGSFFSPSLADMDGDGDLDLFMSGYLLLQNTAGEKMQQPIFLYAKNTGTKTNPNYVGWYQNPYGLDKSIGENQLITIGDVDNDNDNDIISLTTSNNSKMLKYYQNTPRADGKADFKTFTKVLTGIPATSGSEMLFPPALVDIDGDGDLDLFMLQELVKDGKGIAFYENNSCKAKTTQTAQSICEGDSIVVGAQAFKQAGQYDVKLQASNRCDSIVKLNLTVFPKATSNLVKSICSGDVFTIGNQSFSQTGLYNIKFNTSKGCDSIVKLNLTVYPSDTITFLKLLCAGEVFTIGNEKFTQTGHYFIKLKSGNGCDSTVSASLTFVSLNNSVTQSQNKLTADLSGVLYQWIDCETGIDIPGATGQSFAPSKNGKYKVKLMDANGCQSTSVCLDFVYTANDEISLSNQLILYPNPSSGYLTLINQTGCVLNSVKILSIDGAFIKNISNRQFDKINTAELNPGTYMIEINCKGSKIVKKFDVIR